MSEHPPGIGFSLLTGAVMLIDEQADQCNYLLTILDVRLVSDEHRCLLFAILAAHCPAQGEITPTIKTRGRNAEELRSQDWKQIEVTI
eukprot:6344123-Amphidinium_carterae.1